jgi:SWI/SNF-related matrix-associated actin-dependent regulator 1 of chromatin subfamily A
VCVFQQLVFVICFQHQAKNKCTRIFLPSTYTINQQQAATMDSDPIVSSPVKRQKTAGGFRPAGRRTFTHTTATSAPPVQQRAASSAPRTFANLMADLDGTSQPSSYNTQTYLTQPTQPLAPSRKRSHSSTPTVQVARSSPAPVPESPMPQQSFSMPQSKLGARFAPPGTAFRRPPGIQQPARPQLPLINIDDDDDFVDPPVDRSSDTDTRSAIAPTAFTKGGRNLDSSPNRTHQLPKSSEEKFKSLTSSFTYNGGSMESAYGGVSRNKPKQRQSGPSRALPVEDDMTLEDIPEEYHRRNVKRIMSILPGRAIHVYYKASREYHGNQDDATDYILRQEEYGNDMHDVVDLTSSDIESNAAKPNAQARPAAKQQVKAPTRTIADKYQTKPPKPTATTSETTPDAKPRRRLMQGRRNPASPEPSPSPVRPAQAAVKKRTITVIDSDASDAESGKASSEGDTSGFDGRLLNFFNTCSAQDLADMSNEKLEIAQFVLSKKPFRSLNAIRNISDAPPLKSGKRSAKKAIGDKVLDVCEEMYKGYEAVDELVEKCDNLGKPIADTMKQWGIDITAAAKDGELALTSIEDMQQDSGIGTPASSTGGVMDDDDDDVVKIKSTRPNKSKKNVFLKQPANMSNDIVMKDYQLFGLNWLNLLWSKKLSCILADDMGLGKTCQVIAFLAHLKFTQVKGVHLVVVPGSTLENWIRELNRFCPALEVAPYYGSQIERDQQRQDYGARLNEIDVIVTTYETAVGKYDTDFLRKTVRPVVCVFDEGHALKNSQSKRHQQLMRIPAEFRLLLTGTPLQNNLQELASLLSFILPSLFNSRRDELDNIFKFKATTKDADHAALLSAQRIQRARSMMTPFILRRKKQQVLKHMPAKHRRVEHCHMLPEQQVIYNEMVKEALDARTQPKKGKAAKTAQEMTALRFAALHPLLLRRKYNDKELEKIAKALQRSEEYGDNKPDLIWRLLTEQTKGGDYGMHRFCLEYDFLSKFALRNSEWMNSGKVQKLQALLETYINNGDRVLIFSQFTTMMDILEAVLETLSIKFMRLDGSTPMSTRQDIIDQFTTDTSIPVFMLSTKAGGAGINLACANKVIILDSGFNPQDDIQAENRAHRVGQTRDVEVVRLVTKGTIEEQIHALGESKLALDDRVAGLASSSGAGDDAAADKKMESEAALAVEDLFFKQLEQQQQQQGKSSDLKKEEEEQDVHPKMADKKVIVDDVVG